jgi:hypothetical protein
MWNTGIVESKDYPLRHHYSVDGVNEVLDKFLDRGIKQYKLVVVNLNDVDELERMLSEGWELLGTPQHNLPNGVLVQAVVR